ncbi:MAG: lytic transglycosylase domain-containing protein [Proteobacteria bacterium]|nr:lytic transglycosylase domain-containing protein [Pseudomonadota bacterium]
MVLIKPSYPLPNTPATPLERPLTLAITRQESEFDPRAKSPSGALGMMQLLPGTAKETARKNGLNYSLSRLYEPEYNMTLGSMYLNRMINSYDGSYVMAIAAYNAGPGNVRKFVQRFGTPENKLHTAINWIETIPFPETRNYVQRVLENLQVYRALHGQPLSLDKDLMR